MKALKPIIKILLSALILYFVFKKVDLPSLWLTLKGTQPAWIILAFVLFLLSQYVSSLRLLAFWDCLKLNLGKQNNWRLYLLGMYYNLLLPGGIGGDGYKVYLLNKQFEVKKTKLVTALILDRLSGLLGLGIWFCALCGLYLYFSQQFLYLCPILAILPLVAIFISYFIVKRFFTEYVPIYSKSAVLSVIIQGLQLAASLSILLALGTFKHILAYLTLFLISSIAAVIPITVGGAGARELTFLTGASYFTVDLNIAIALSVIFFMITVLSSLLGLRYSFKNKIFE